MQQTALVPAWLKVCCPNVTSLKVEHCTLTPHLLGRAATRAAALTPPGSSAQHAAPAPLTCRALSNIYVNIPIMTGESSDDNDDDDDDNGGSRNRVRWQRHVCRQLAALPSLTSLAMGPAGHLLRPTQVSTSLTSLHITECYDARRAARLAAQFPNLRHLDARHLTADDATLESLLGLPCLERLAVWGFDLQHCHAEAPWAVRHLAVTDLDVGSFARLPLDGVQTCTLGEDEGQVFPTGDVQAVARVAEAVRRWGGLGREARVAVYGYSAAAVLATLGPLLAALPAAQRREVSVSDSRDAAPATLQALGRQLPAGVAVLRLKNCTLQPEAWRVLLPSLPATVAELRLQLTVWPREEQLVALCGAAVRRVRVAVRGLSQGALERVMGCLVQLGKAQMVDLVRW